jgi:hypothetical protein
VGGDHHTKKRAGGVAQGIGPEFKPQYRNKKVGGGLEEWLNW